jgi:hypothetical protein
MSKSIKRRSNKISNKKKNKRTSKRTNKRSNKKVNKNIKRVSIKKLHRGHKMHKARHYSRALHQRGATRYGGHMHGGMVSSPSAGPVGYSWDGGNVATWPGAQASEGLDTNGATMSNHFSLSKNGIVVGGLEPARSTSDDQIIKGGRRMKKRKGTKQKGGFVQELINVVRGGENSVNGGYYNLIGKTQPISQNPYPTQEQPIDTNYKFSGQPPSNVRQIYIDANNSVAKI